MKNREIFQRDPVQSKLLNDGVAAVVEATTSKEIETLRFEIEHFVCEGQYKDGLARILESYLGNIDSTVQPAAWVSGFYGSGKSHMLKMLRHLWVNTEFDSDGATSRGLTHLPDEVMDLLKELDTLGRRCNGLHAASGTLPSGGGESVRLDILGIVFRSKGLLESLPQAQFCLWLMKNNIYDQVQDAVENAGKNFKNELHDLYVSPILAKALLKVDPNFAPDEKQARAVLRNQFPVVEDVSTAEFIRILREILSVDGQIPCTLIVLDEIQLFIGDSPNRSTDVQEAAEAICKQLDSRVLLIGAGQTALASNVPLLQRLRGRFTIPIELSDADVETVTRRVVLSKKADKRKSVEDILNSHVGEIDRQLAGSRIAACSSDRNIIVDDYPLLPVRRRFWEHVLRAVDIPGTSSQLRTQLKIVYDAARETAEKELGTVVSADFIFDQLQPDLLRTGVLLREIDETIRGLDDSSDDGKLAKRICGLVFLIRKLPTEQVADIGVRATADTLADLLVSDLSHDGTKLRRDIPRILGQLVDQGKLIKVDNEYSLQTRESSEWDREFRNRQTRLNNDPTALASKRATVLNAACGEALRDIKLLHGSSKVPRKIQVHFGSEPPTTDGQEIPIWVRDGWGEREKVVMSDARAAGNDSPVIFAYIPKSSADDLKKAIVDYEAAKATINFKGAPNTPEGQEAREAMTTRMNTALSKRDSIVRDVIDTAKVIQGGGTERYELTIVEKIRSVAEASLDRLFPNFRDADDKRWESVIRRAKNGDEAALQAIGWDDQPDRQPVCSAVLSEIGAGKKGKEIRTKFESSPFGWPRDAIDGALIVLFTTGHIRAVHNGKQLKPKELDQAKISVTDFRTESATIPARSRIKLRKLFQSIGLICQSGEESTVASQFLVQLADIAERAGGNPPLPQRPATTHLDELRSMVGNEQLAGILEKHDTLKKQTEDWQKLAEIAAKRKPAWETLCRFLHHAESLPESKELLQQADAVKNERRLLDENDPIPEIQKKAAKTLRSALKKAHDALEKRYELEMKNLTVSENWQKLQPEQQQKILSDEGIAGIPALSVGDDKALLRTLEETPLPIWKTKLDALPQQFANAAIAAAQLLEPKTQNVHLKSNTLKTEQDVKGWLAGTEKDLLAKLNNGPIMIG